MPEPWRFEKIKLKSGITLRVARCGSGPPIVMLHGFPECWYSWRHQIRALSDRFECVAPEMRGYGESDAPMGVGNYTLDKLVGVNSIQNPDFIVAGQTLALDGSAILAD